MPQTGNLPVPCELLAPKCQDEQIIRSRYSSGSMNVIPPANEFKWHFIQGKATQYDAREDN